MRRTTSQFPLLYSSITEPIDSSNYNFVNEIEMLGYDDALSDILIEIGNQQIANLLPNQECFNTQLSENDLNGWEVEMENFLNLDSVSDTLEESVKIENKNNSVKRTKAETKRLENEMIEKEKKERAKRLEEKKKIRDTYGYVYQSSVRHSKYINNFNQMSGVGDEGSAFGKKKKK